jgi:hypothetical protein
VGPALPADSVLPRQPQVGFVHQFGGLDGLGSPAGNVSFWTNKVNFVRTFEKTEGVWLPVSNHAVSEVRVFGMADLNIEYFYYSFSDLNSRATLTAMADTKMYR